VSVHNFTQSIPALNEEYPKLTKDISRLRMAGFGFELKLELELSWNYLEIMPLTIFNKCSLSSTIADLYESVYVSI